MALASLLVVILIVFLYLGKETGMALITRDIAFLIDIRSLCVVGKETGIVLGSLCIVAGIIFLIDFLYLSSWKGDGNGTGKPLHRRWDHLSD